MKLNSIIIQEGKLYSERVLLNLYNKPLFLTAFSSDFKLDNNILILENIAAELFNGKLIGNIDYKLKDESFNSKIMARGVSALPIFNIVSQRRDSIGGIMDFDLKMSGNLIMKKSLNGEMKFVVNNGMMSTLGKLEHLLYAQNVVSDNMLRTSLNMVAKAITLKNTGLFKYLRGDINLSDNIARINMLQSHGPHMSLFIKGNYDIENDQAQLNVLGRISDDVISGLGAFGEFSLNKLMIMLTGEDDNYNIHFDDINMLPDLQSKNTREFRSIISGHIDKPSSVKFFNWISYTNKSLKQKEVPLTNTKLPSFLENIPY
jgi:hypothetical protein